jgi:hypothetical protein
LTTYQYFSVGSYTDTLIVTDAAGNVDSCFATITVVDNNAPVAVCNDTTLYLDAAGSASITPADLDGGSTDNGVITALAASQTSFSCANVGTLTDTLFVTDDGGNTSFCLANVTVIDTVAPVAICQPLTVQLDASGNATITPAQVDNGSSDNCTIASLNLDVTSFDCSNVGANTVTLTVTDVNGNSSSCTAIITVQDNIAPSLACPADLVTGPDANSCSATVTYSVPVASDNCSGVTVALISGPASGSLLAPGTYTVSYRATDAVGNFTDCSFIINVNPGSDHDGDAVCDNVDLDDDNDGIPDMAEGGFALDTDGDGVPDRFDLDSDNDGIYDALESGSAQPFTSGVLNGPVTSLGIPSSVDGNSDGTIDYTVSDSDGDGTIDSMELDSDGDGCPDVLEAGYTDANGDGLLGPAPLTTDNSTGLVTSGGL